MSRQMTLSDMAVQRTLPDCADTLTTERDLLDRAQQHVADVAGEHIPDLPLDAIEWTFSHCAQRTARATKYDPENGEITISLAWDTSDSHGWEQYPRTETS